MRSDMIDAEGCTFLGKKLTEMTRDELIQAVLILGRQTETQRESARRMNETWSAIARARAAA